MNELVIIDDALDVLEDLLSLWRDQGKNDDDYDVVHDMVIALEDMRDRREE